MLISPSGSQCACPRDTVKGRECSDSFARAFLPLQFISFSMFIYSSISFLRVCCASAWVWRIGKATNYTWLLRANPQSQRLPQQPCIKIFTRLSMTSVTWCQDAFLLCFVCTRSPSCIHSCALHAFMHLIIVIIVDVNEAEYFEKDDAPIQKGFTFRPFLFYDLRSAYLSVRLFNFTGVSALMVLCYSLNSLLHIHLRNKLQLVL